MVQIIVTILKFAGIIVGILVLLVLALLLLLLFVPIKYEFFGKNKDEMVLNGKAYWLFHIVSYGIEYKNKELKQVLRIFGVPIWKR